MSGKLLLLQLQQFRLKPLGAPMGQFSVRTRMDREVHGRHELQKALQQEEEHKRITELEIVKRDLLRNDELGGTIRMPHAESRLRIETRLYDRHLVIMMYHGDRYPGIMTPLEGKPLADQLLPEGKHRGVQPLLEVRQLLGDKDQEDMIRTKEFQLLPKVRDFRLWGKETLEELRRERETIRATGGVPLVNEKRDMMEVRHGNRATTMTSRVYHPSEVVDPKLELRLLWLFL
mmetsp:Transcript_1444/g.1725  ORF Transcript_1444/g.1725 Transcript_1444/m.1725 type:complete len:232 (+) Transcript_1444:23-718(+)